MGRGRSVRVTDGGREVVIPAETLVWQFARSAGPGGQHVNRTSTKAMLRFDVAHATALPDDVRRRILARERARLTADGCLVIASQRHREQSRNVADCLDKLAEVVRRALVPPRVRRPTRTPRAALAARAEAKRRRARVKQLRRPPAE